MAYDVTPPLVPAPDTGPTPPGLSEAVSRVFGTAPKPQKVDPYKDDKALLKLFERLKREASTNRTVFERQWWRSLHFFLGRQWIYYSTRHGEWRDVRLEKWIPKPVTNKIRENGQAFRATMAAINLHCLVRPVGNAEKQLVAAEIGSDLEPLIKAEHEMDAVQDEADFWFTYTGNYFLHPWYDADADPVVQPGMACVNCDAKMPETPMGMPPVCPCGSMQFMPSQKFGTLRPKGRGRTDVCSPLEILIPPNAVTLESAGFLIRQRWRDKDYCENHYDEGLVKKISWRKAPGERSLQLYRTLSTQNDISGGANAFSANAQPSEAEGVEEYELWLKPTSTYPGGLALRVVGETSPLVVMNADEGLPGPFPLTDLEGKPIFPWVHAQFERIGGRIWAGSFVDPAIQKQIQLNQIDSYIQLTFQRTSNPIYLEPKGAEVEKFTGEPGLVIKWNPLAAGGQAKPERLPGENIPTSLFAIREQYIQDIEDLLGTHDVMKGGKPPGVESYSGLALLDEKSKSRFARAYNNRGEAYRKWFAIALEMERAYGPEERLSHITGPNNEWTATSFKNADLQGEVSIIVEDGTQVPKTALGYRASLEHANQLQVLPRQNAETQFEILRSLGLTKLMPTLDADVREALREQEAFEEFVKSQGSQGEMLARKPWHNDEVHLAQNRKWMNSDRFRELIRLNSQVEQMAAMHLEEHYAPLALALQAAQPQPTSGKSEPVVGAGQTFRNSQRESTTGNEPGGNQEQPTQIEHPKGMPGPR